MVKGVRFVDIVDAGDPVEVARRYDEQGADELAFLDITASSDERDTLVHVVEAVASEVFIPLTVGGGVRELGHIRRLLNAGADKVSINTAAVANPRLVADAAAKVGSQCIVVAVDARRRDGDDGGARALAGTGTGTAATRRGAGGRSTPTAAGARPASTRSSGARGWSPSGRARSSSPAWTGTGPGMASTSP